MKAVKFTPILDKKEYIKEFQKQTFPQIAGNLEVALNFMNDQGLLLNHDGTVNNVAQNALRYAIYLNKGGKTTDILNLLKGLESEDATEQEIKDSFTILGILTYFVDKGPKLFIEYLEYHGNIFGDETYKKVLRQKERFKIYKAEIKLEKAKKEAREVFNK